MTFLGWSHLRAKPYVLDDTALTILRGLIESGLGL